MSAIDDLFGLEGKVAIVTGGSRGIGLMAARGLLQAGARVYVASRKSDAVAAAVTELEEFGPVTGLSADLSTENGCTAFAAEIMAREDHIDILVNNAGATWGAALEDFPAAAWDRVFNVNVKAPFFLTQAFLPLLERSGSQDDPARIINIGSIDAIHTPQHEAYSYGPSKAAVHQLTRVLAAKLGEKWITVNAIAPGPFESKMMASRLAESRDEIAAHSRLNRIGRPDDIAGGVVFLSSRAGSYLTGAIIPIDGGIATTVGS
ncbi:3-oxoacyl-ACP reductase [Aeromicrobium sp. A1-2]|uniref:SDR family oxidoreductase n=1 Tax=Aeromicrobium sp. A1-2 TaxID=2107713 RepID=UPI000E508900|nr:SDR family oxidoreductase [Aeromicrobium sp. A1-2]AXT84376.1 3-oxoacyl-ACP reductase [Aeromicrobium sp. A1-2]